MINFSGVHKIVRYSCIVLLYRVVFATEKLSAGESLHGYTVDRVSSLPEFDAKTVQLIHDRTKAKHLHVVRKDTNNTFRYIYVKSSLLV